jgi:uncharacterized protein YjiS (DUF1127 family)
MAQAVHHPLTNCHSAPKPDAASLDVAGMIGRAFRRWRERNAELRELDLMTDRDLSDARLSRWAARDELAKPFWRE